jgi:hypothetical protein
MYYINSPIYYILALVIMVWSVAVQTGLKSKAKNGSKIPAASGKTANQIVQEMLSAHDIYGITIEHKPGELTDCYSPREGKIYLSDTTYNKSSITAIAVAAHECGHAVQDHENMPIYKFRQFLAPAAGICSMAGVYIVAGGLLLSYIAENMGEFGFFICNLGITVYLITFLFYLVMLPVERDASRRAYKDMKEFGWVGDDQIKQTYKILRAAGDTYAVALASSALTLFRLLLMRGNTRRRR